MQIHQIKRNTPNKNKKTVGRGGKRGKTSGKGTKGQNARAGRKFRPAMRDAIKKLPKLRGYNFNSIQTKPETINLSQISLVASEGAVLTPVSLVELGLVSLQGGKFPKIKILGNGSIDKKVTVSGCDISASAKEKIEAVGGSVTE
jgi:large subunit ribosomal protein L15